MLTALSGKIKKFTEPKKEPKTTDAIQVHDCIPISKLHPLKKENGFLIVAKPVVWVDGRQHVLDEVGHYHSQKSIPPKTRLSPESPTIMELGEVFPPAEVEAILANLKGKPHAN